MNWNQPLPIELFTSINKVTDVPKECPTDSPTSLNIRCGPILKLFNCEKEYIASMLIVLEDYDEVPEISFKVGPLKIDSDNQCKTGVFKGKRFYQEENYHFFRFDINLPVVDFEQKCQYFVNGETTDYWMFYVPSLNQSMNVMSFSCNGFSLGCDAGDYPSSLWHDVLKNHSKKHYHVMLGGGDQIYCDSIKLASTYLQSWLGKSNNKDKFNAPATEEVTNEFSKYYLNHYMAWFGKGYWEGLKSSCLESLFPIASTTIPAINIYDDHDIIDGYGSYPDSTMSSPIFKSLGKIAYKYYMIYQHHQLPGETITYEKGWIKGKDDKNFMSSTPLSTYAKLGNQIGLVGFDCRTERSLEQIIKPQSYKAIFDRMALELKNSPDIKHFLVMLGVPILYPRLVWLELVLNSPLLVPIRKLAEKGIINKGLVNEFDGGVEVLDDLNDHWCSKHHKAERNKLLKDLIDFGAANSVRITILSGDVHLCCIGRLKSRYYHHPNFHRVGHKGAIEHNEKVLKSPEYDPRLIFNVISSAIINAPPPDPMANLLNKRSKGHHFSRDCDEDMVPLFNVNPDGSSRDNYQFLNKRNWCDLIIAPQSELASKVGQDHHALPSSIKKEFNHSTDNHFIKYPLLPESLVTTIHVEDDPKDFETNTMGYQVLIPPLQGKFALDDAPVKHVDGSD